ncbi:hypothetical protein ACOSQ2_012576 [Xanthoceras sorbifolium]|uniref:Uncharacterized protein n=1 Tax=Xanthoceras sorbifolium TaxID=99658 RepID=A0ABQ8HXI0_9ROSI|nr:hypothetical protein JRO89_XS06G0096100 [Xanthoceras sorbifolium]
MDKSPRTRPISIVSSAKPVVKVGVLNMEIENTEVDELSESYTCVICHFGDNLVKKRVYLMMTSLRITVFSLLLLHQWISVASSGVGIFSVLVFFARNSFMDWTFSCTCICISPSWLIYHGLCKYL